MCGKVDAVFLEVTLQQTEANNDRFILSMKSCTMYGWRGWAAQKFTFLLFSYQSSMFRLQ